MYKRRRDAGGCETMTTVGTQEIEELVEKVFNVIDSENPDLKSFKVCVADQKTCESRIRYMIKNKLFNAFKADLEGSHKAVLSCRNISNGRAILFLTVFKTKLEDYKNTGSRRVKVK